MINTAEAFRGLKIASKDSHKTGGSDSVSDHRVKGGPGSATGRTTVSASLHDGSSSAEENSVTVTVGKFAIL